ncbi:MAG: ATP-binding protein [Desulfobacteraceae bacterium]|nr:ATP-binding protein [Desulfobacteraceae bacterium]
MFKNDPPLFKYGLRTSPWIVVGSAAILLVTILVLALQSYRRDEQYMARILSEKGAALIRTIEAGARTGMMRMMWGGDQVQALIEESALVPEVRYILILDPQGRALAASDRALIGAQTVDRPYLKNLDPSERVQWRLVRTADQARSFEVYKIFRPMGGRPGPGGMRDERPHLPNQGPMGPKGKDWCFGGDDPPGGRAVILVGLDPSAYEVARKTDIRNTVVLCAVLVVLGLAGFISMYWMQSFRSAQRALQDTSAIADEIVTSLPVGLIATDKSGKIAFFNSAAERITGLDLSQARGQEPAAVLPANFCGLRESLEQGAAVFEKEMTCEFVANKIVPVSISASKIMNEAGQLVGHVMILRDLGEVRQLQESLRRQEKLAAIGGLAAGVAHEIRNPLSSIKGMATYFKSKFATGSEDKEAAEVMIQEVERLNRVISELLDFVRPTDLQWKATDLNELIAHSARLIQQEAATQHIAVRLKPAPQPVMAEVDADRLSQCLLNLYLNALQAMARGGELTVTLTALGPDAVRIDVEDSGEGIAAQDLDKVFDPYFTTKAKGTGLGLAIVHKIVTAHNGHVKISSTAGRGTKVSLIFPTRQSM